MNLRQNNIIKTLKREDKWIVGKELSQKFSVSDRTIRSDIEQINNAYPNYVESNRRYGYRINPEMIESKIVIPSELSPQERSIFILKKLLGNHNKVKVYQLLNELFISEATLDMDIKRMRHIIKSYEGLKIVRKNNFIYIDGNEFSKRELYRNLLANEVKDNFVNINKIANLYESFDLLKIMKHIENVLDEYDYRLRATSFPMLALHLGITLNRILGGNIIYMKEEAVDKNSQEYEISKIVFAFIKHLYNFEIYESEVISFAKLLSGYKEGSKDKHYITLYGKSYDGEDILSKICDVLEEEFSIDLHEDKEFITGFNLHLTSLFKRLGNKQLLQSTQFSGIKNQYPLVFEIAVYIGKYIMDTFDVDISEIELGFIAIHIGAAYDRLFMHKKMEVVIVGLSNSPLEGLLIDKINSRFGDRLNIKAVIPYFIQEDILKLKPDLLLTLSPLVHNLIIPTIAISMFLDSKDESEIFQTLNKIEAKRVSLSCIQYMDELVEEKFFYGDCTLSSQEDVLSFMVGNLEKEGYVDSGYIDSIIERENLASTSFEVGVAVPHALNKSPLIPSISIANLEKPIKWGEFEVRFVILLCVDNEDMDVLHVFFDWLSQTVTNQNLLNSLFKVKSRNEFLDIIQR